MTGTLQSKTTVNITKLKGKKLNLKKNYKFYVVAYKKVNGKKVELCRTLMAHIVGRENTKYTNIKSIRLKTKQMTLTVGKSRKIKAKLVLVDPKKKMLSKKHAPKFRYATSDSKVATVSKKGKVIARGKGQCYIWVYAKNGYARKTKVTVK